MNFPSTQLDSILNGNMLTQSN